jgi:Arc/MetJ-type ribon-helix-helix transcriptional regulator
MATTKITIALPEDKLERIRALVSARQAASVSAFVKHAVKVALDDEAEWEQMLEDALQRTGGPLTKKEARLGRRRSLRTATEGNFQEKAAGRNGITLEAGVLIAQMGSHCTRHRAHCHPSDGACSGYS